MAHFEKFTTNAGRGIILHCERKIHTEKSFINDELTCKNINHTFYDCDKKFIEQNDIFCLKRNDVKSTCSLILTLPENVNSNDQIKFFQSSFNFFVNETLEKSNFSIPQNFNNMAAGVPILGYYIHFDETTPHMHIIFSPVVFDQEKQKLKISAKEFLTKEYLTHFHDRLCEHVTKDLGYRPNVVSVHKKERKKARDNVNINVYRERLKNEIHILEQKRKIVQNDLDQKCNIWHDKKLKNQAFDIVYDNFLERKNADRER